VLRLETASTTSGCNRNALAMIRQTTVLMPYKGATAINIPAATDPGNRPSPRPARMSRHIFVGFIQRIAR